MSGLFFAVGLLWILTGLEVMDSDYTVEWWTTVGGTAFLGASVNYALNKIEGK